MLGDDEDLFRFSRAFKGTSLDGWVEAARVEPLTSFTERWIDTKPKCRNCGGRVKETASFAECPVCRQGYDKVTGELKWEGTPKSEILPDQWKRMKA